MSYLLVLSQQIRYVVKTLCPVISDEEEINQSIHQDFMSSWNRGNSNKDDKALREWSVG